MSWLDDGRTEAEKQVLAICRSKRAPNRTWCMRTNDGCYWDEAKGKSIPTENTHTVIDASHFSGSPIAKGRNWDEVLEQLRKVES